MNVESNTNGLLCLVFIIFPRRLMLLNNLRHRTTNRHIKLAGKTRAAVLCAWHDKGLDNAKPLLKQEDDRPPREVLQVQKKRTYGQLYLSQTDHRQNKPEQIN